MTVGGVGRGRPAQQRPVGGKESAPAPRVDTTKSALDQRGVTGTSGFDLPRIGDGPRPTPVQMKIGDGKQVDQIGNAPGENLMPAMNVIGRHQQDVTASQYTAPPGYLLIAGHGDQTGIRTYGGQKYTGTEKNNSAKEMAEQIRKRPDYVPGKPIILHSCNTGNGNDAVFAAQLSKELGCKVYAPPGFSALLPDGKLISAKTMQNGGIMPSDDTGFACYENGKLVQPAGVQIQLSPVKDAMDEVLKYG